MQKHSESPNTSVSHDLFFDADSTITSTNGHCSNEISRLSCCLKVAKHEAYVMRWNFPCWEVDIVRLLIEFYLANKCNVWIYKHLNLPKWRQGFKILMWETPQENDDYSRLDAPEMSPFQFIHPVSRLLCTCRKHSCDRWQISFKNIIALLSQTSDERIQNIMAARCATKFSELTFILNGMVFITELIFKNWNKRLLSYLLKIL